MLSLTKAKIFDHFLYVVVNFVIIGVMCSIFNFGDALSNMIMPICMLVSVICGETVVMFEAIVGFVNFHLRIWVVALSIRTLHTAVWVAFLEPKFNLVQNRNHVDLTEIKSHSKHFSSWLRSVCLFVCAIVMHHHHWTYLTRLHRQYRRRQLVAIYYRAKFRLNFETIT